MRVDVLISGLQPAQTRAIAVAVRRTIGDMGARDILRIAVLPSDAIDRWDVGIRRRDGWSVTWFDSPIEELVAQVTTTLQRVGRDPQL
jgi:hypothetical protein